MYIPPEDQNATGVEGGEFIDVERPDPDDDERRRQSLVDPADRGADSSGPPLETDPDAGRLPSERDVQAERQP